MGGVGGGDELWQRVGEAPGEAGGGAVQIVRHRAVDVVGAEHPPLEAVTALAADGGPGALNGGAVGQHAQPPGRGNGVGEGVAPVELQMVRPDGRVAPKGAADKGVDSVGTDQDVGLVHGSVVHVQPGRLVVLLDLLHRLAGAQYAGRERGQQTLVQVGAEQTDEAAPVGTHHMFGQPDPYPPLAAHIAELALAGGSEVLDVHAEEAEGFDGRGPQIQDVAGRPGLGVPLEERDLVACLVGGERGGHPGGPGTDHGNPARSAGGGGGRGVRHITSPDDQKRSARYGFRFGDIRSAGPGHVSMGASRISARRP